MKKRGVSDFCKFKFMVVFLILVMFISLSLFSSASEKEIYEGDTISVSNGATLNVFDYTYRFTLNAGDTKIYVENTKTTDHAFIGLDRCNNINELKICFDKSSGTTIYVKFYSLVPDLELTHSLKETEIYVGQKNTLNATIENVGEVDLDEFEYSLNIPSKIMITEVDGAEYDEKTIFLNRTLKSGQSKTISITFVATQPYQDLELKSEVLYHNLFSWISQEETTEHDAISKLIIDYELDSKNLYIGNIYKINLFLRNNYTKSKRDTDTGYNMTIENLEIDKKSDFNFSKESLGFILDNSNMLYWQGSLPFNQTKNFTFYITPVRSGKLELPLNIKYSDLNNQENITIEPYVPLVIKSTELEVYPSLDSDMTFNSSSKNFFDITLKNPDPFVSLSDIWVTVKNKNGISQKKLPSLATSTKTKLSGFSFLTSATDELVMEESLDIEIKYKTSLFEERTYNKEITYYVQPHNEVIINHNISSEENGIYHISVFAKNNADATVKKINVKESIPEIMFIKGNAKGTLESLRPKKSSLIAEYDIVAPGINLSKDYDLSSSFSYEVNNITKIFSEKYNLTDMIHSLNIKETYWDEKKKEIESIFSSLEIFVLFVFSVFVFIVAFSSLFMYRRKFSLQGIKDIKTKQQRIDKKKNILEKKESTIKKTKRSIDSKIKSLKSYMQDVKKELKKKMPILEEKKSGLELRQKELMKEKKMIDDKIAELKELESKILRKNMSYEKEKRELDKREKELNDKFHNVKKRLSGLGSHFEELLKDESVLNKKKEDLTKTELSLLAKKQRLLSDGDETISSEKVNVIEEKVKLEHERNSIEEELFSLKNRRKDIDQAQEDISKQHVDLKKEKNIFDMNKGTVDKSLGTLLEQSEKIKEILDSSKKSNLEEESEESSDKEKDK